MATAAQQLTGVDRFRVTVEGLGRLALSFAGPLERGGEDPPTLVLRRALGSDRDLFGWYEESVRDRGRHRDVAICQLEGSGGRVLNCWIARRARPVRWRGPSFDALALEVAQEELEHRYERLDWIQDPRRAPLCRGAASNPRRRRS